VKLNQKTTDNLFTIAKSKGFTKQKARLMRYLQTKQIAVTTVRKDKHPFFEDPNWANVETIVASDTGRSGVYFLASQAEDYDKKINISVIKPSQNPGNDFFAHQISTIYGLPSPDSKLIRIDKATAIQHIDRLTSNTNQRTVAGARKFYNALITAPTNHLFEMKFINGDAIDTIDNDNTKVALFKEKKFLKALGYTLPFDALICNGDRFNKLNFYDSSNLGNMILQKNGEFIAIDNGINALGEIEDYQDVPMTFYQKILSEITEAVYAGNRDVIDTIAIETAKSIASECPKLRLDAEQTRRIGDGIIAGIHKLITLDEEKIQESYAGIPEDSGKTEEALNLVLDNLRIVHSYKETSPNT
jgi:hypothetical protein